MKKFLVIGLGLYAIVATGLLLHRESIVVAAGGGGAAGGGTPLGNGDVNGDGIIGLNDAVYLLTWLFLGGDPPAPIEPCAVGDVDPLGRGYDIFGTYANREEVKQPILDVNLLKRDGMIDTHPLERSDYSSLYGTNISTYSTSLMESCGVSGNYGGFSGAIKQSFEQDRYQSDQYSFATVKIYVHKSESVVAGREDVDLLKQYLMPTFKLRLEDPTYSPNTLFALYGTHCMTAVVNGARLDYNVSAKTSELAGGKSIGVYAQASYKMGLCGASLDTSVVTQEQYNQYNNSESKKLKAFGGKSEMAVNIATKGDFDAWLATIEENPVFCDYSASSSLVPIWNFLPDGDRKTAVLAAFGAWAKAREISVNRTPRLAILHVAVVDPPVGDTYSYNTLTCHVMGQNMNQGCGGGDNILLYAAVDLDNDAAHPPITSLLIWDETDSPKEEPSAALGYVRLGANLNAGHSGDVIWLYASTDPSLGSPIRAIRTDNPTRGAKFYSDQASASQTYLGVPDTTGFQRKDLNEGAGGDYIFLEYSTDYIDQ